MGVTMFGSEVPAGPKAVARRVTGCDAVAVTSSDLWDAETAERYDGSSAFMFAPDVLDPTVDFLAELAGDGPALELAIGTGRVAIPLTQRGISVTGHRAVSADG